VYTTPVLAAVGHTEASARAAGIEPIVASAAVSDTVRSTTEGSADGWLKLLADPRRGTLVGATAMGGYAEEWISEVSLAVRAEVPVTAHADVVHPFPTYSEILEGALWRLAAQLST
jgi:pyruvate/2-oxoglutarate dehydrogenase complex dihydrolipoamide dehydrogenase (E3) component